MSIDSTMPAPPPAWYADPADNAQLRWWTGTAWSADTSAPVVAAYQPMGGYELHAADPVVYDEEPGSPLTAWVWLLALLPLALAGIAVARLGTSGYLYLGPVGLYVTFALFDRRALVSRGYDSAPNQWWILLAPVYFVLRARRTAAIGYAPALLWVAAAIVAGIIIGTTVLAAGAAPEEDESPTAIPVGLVAPFTEAQLDYLLTPEGMAIQIQSDAGIAIDDFVCEPLSSLEVSVTTTCSGTFIGAPINASVIVIERDTSSEPFLLLSLDSPVPF